MAAVRIRSHPTWTASPTACPATTVKALRDPKARRFGRRFNGAERARRLTDEGLAEDRDRSVGGRVCPIAHDPGRSRRLPRGVGLYIDILP